ncbi:MAG TPA: HAD-IA family hydrolase [Acidobacteriaceae bacterium]|jgi:sugar-phosphatase|nr:HAD-IA family hydrolase [Acidobacteriaceae bacterium]
MAQVVVEVSGLLFDMDGVLVSSIGSVIRSWRRWAKHYGLPNAETLEIPHGTRAIDIVRQVKPDLDPEEGLRLIEEIELEDTEDLKVLRGVRPLLESLPHERWAIVTSATRRLLLGRLKAAGLPVPDRIISGDMVKRGKPDPEPYRRGAELLGVAPGDCLVFEDAPSGATAGVAAGCSVLGVLGTHSAEELREAGVEWVVESLAKVRAEVRGGRIVLEMDAV